MLLDFQQLRRRADSLIADELFESKRLNITRKFFVEADGKVKSLPFGFYQVKRPYSKIN